MNSTDEEEDCESLPLEDDDQMEVTEKNVRTVIENNGGKITNKALVKQFKKALSSSKDNRTKFQAIINELAVVEKDTKGRDVISLKKVDPVDENKQPEEPERPKDLPATSDDAPSTSKDVKDGMTPTSAPSESPVAEVKSPFDSAESPTGEKVRDRAKMFETGGRASQEKDTPSGILRSLTDDKTFVCASGHAEEDNTISDSMAAEEIAPPQLDDVKRKWMIMAARSDYHDMARLLQDHRHLAGWKNFVNGYTALHYAAKAGKDDCIKMLAGTYKAKVNAITHAGMTPLHLAAIHNRGPAIRVLVEVYKADPNIRDYNGKLPKDYLKDVQTRRMSMQKEYEDILNNQMLLEPIDQISNATLRYFYEAGSGTLPANSGTLEGAAGGTLKSLDPFAASNLLRRSFRVGSTRPPTNTLMAEQRYAETLTADPKGFYASSMKRGQMPPVSRTMSMPKSRTTSKKHIKNQKKFTSMIEEIAEENDS